MLDTKSGSVAGNLTEGTEPLAGYYKMTGATFSNYISSGLTAPCGIDYADGRLIVSDNADGSIYVYNTSGSSPVLMGTIKMPVVWKLNTKALK